MKKFFSIFKSSQGSKDKKGTDAHRVTPSQKPMPNSKQAESYAPENDTSTTTQSPARKNLDVKMPEVERKHNLAINNLPANLPDEILELAAINDAFLQGILALQKMNLDEDLFLQAVNDLREKYVNLRQPYLAKKIGDSQEPDKKPKQKHIRNS